MTFGAAVNSNGGALNYFSGLSGTASLSASQSNDTSLVNNTATIDGGSIFLGPGAQVE